MKINNFLKILFIFLFIPFSLSSAPLPSSAAGGLSLYKTIGLGESLSVSLPTDLPAGTNDVKFFIIKKNSSDTLRSGKFGLSGVHGEWDLILSSLFNQYWDPDSTGDKMLEKHFATLATLGISRIRTEFSWERVEPKEGNFNFTNLDKIFDAAKKYNIEMMVSLVFTPSWMSGLCPGKNTDNPWFSSPSDLNQNGSVLYNRYISKVVERYKPYGTKDSSGYGITHWQIWNEPDIYFWTDCQTGAVGNLQTYSHLLKSAYQTIKAVHPQARIILGGLTHIDPAARLRQIYSYLGPAKSFDILDIHYYESDLGTVFTDKIKAYAQARDDFGDQSKEIWVSETSSGNPDYQTTYLTNIFNQLEKLSAQNITRGFWWGPRAYFFDVNNLNVGENKNAIMDNNFFPRKVFFDYGSWLGTVSKKAEIQASPVSGGNVSATISKNILSEAGEYIIFPASPSKMVTILPVVVAVSGKITPAPTITPTPKATNTPTPPPDPKTPGDANSDAKVNITDFAIWKKEFLTQSGLTSDFDSNSKININDFAIWKAEYLKSR